MCVCVWCVCDMQWLLRAFPRMVVELTDDNRSPLHLAVEFRYHGVVRLLLSHAAEQKLVDDVLTLADHKGCLPLHLAAERGDLVLVALLSGQTRGVDEEMDAVANAVRDNMNQRSRQLVCEPSSKSGYEAIHYACVFGCVQTVGWLLEHGAGVSCVVLLVTVQG